MSEAYRHAEQNRRQPKEKTRECIHENVAAASTCCCAFAVLPVSTSPNPTRDQTTENDFTPTTTAETANLAGFASTSPVWYSRYQGKHRAAHGQLSGHSGVLRREVPVHFQNHVRSVRHVDADDAVRARRDHRRVRDHAPIPRVRLSRPSAVPPSDFATDGSRSRPQVHDPFPPPSDCLIALASQAQASSAPTAHRAPVRGGRGEVSRKAKPVWEARQSRTAPSAIPTPTSRHWPPAQTHTSRIAGSSSASRPRL